MEKIFWIIVGVVVVGGSLWLWKTIEAPLPSATVSPADATTVSTDTQTTSSAVTAANITTNQQNTMPTNITQATLHTNKGDITFTFLPQQAPNTVANFIKLAQSAFYDGTKFHRVIKGFMNQGGDPLTKDDSMAAQWGTGGPGYKFDNEVGPGSKNVKGSVAMANAGPNTNGSQFFINAVDNPTLDGGYTVFGQVTAGMDVVTAINNVPVDSSDRPLTPVVLESVTLK